MNHIEMLAHFFFSMVMVIGGIVFMLIGAFLESDRWARKPAQIAIKCFYAAAAICGIVSIWNWWW